MVLLSVFARVSVSKYWSSAWWVHNVPWVFPQSSLESQYHNTYPLLHILAAIRYNYGECEEDMDIWWWILKTDLRNFCKRSVTYWSWRMGRVLFAGRGRQYFLRLFLAPVMGEAHGFGEICLQFFLFFYHFIFVTWGTLIIVVTAVIRDRNLYFGSVMVEI